MHLNAPTKFQMNSSSAIYIANVSSQGTLHLQCVSLVMFIIKLGGIQENTLYILVVSFYLAGGVTPVTPVTRASGRV